MESSDDAEPGEEIYTPSVNLPPGEYEFYCRFHRARGMRGTLMVTGSRDPIIQRRGY